jgi:hypothetical protein
LKYSLVIPPWIHAWLSCPARCARVQIRSRRICGGIQAQGCESTLPSLALDSGFPAGMTLGLFVTILMDLSTRRSDARFRSDQSDITQYGFSLMGDLH